jgi:hypothetical protein
MNDLLEALKNRLNSPLFGYFGLALLAFNWRAFFFLFVQDGDVIGRIQFFEQNTTLNSLLIFPLSFSFLFAVIYPWLLFLVAWVTAKPVEMKDMVQASSEDRVLLRRKQLEEARSSILASTEMELIERAKRDQELDKLQSEEIRNKLKMELEQLRSERDSLRENGKSITLHARHKELMDIAGTYRKRAEESNSYDDKESFLQRARELEEQAHKLLLNSELMDDSNA